jgi:hypothetical protein
LRLPGRNEFIRHLINSIHASGGLRMGGLTVSNGKKNEKKPLIKSKFHENKD